jgi:hypothetical protein
MPPRADTLPGCGQCSIFNTIAHLEPSVWEIIEGYGSAASGAESAPMDRSPRSHDPTDSQTRALRRIEMTDDRDAQRAARRAETEAMVEAEAAKAKEVRSVQS